MHISQNHDERVVGPGDAPLLQGALVGLAGDPAHRGLCDAAHVEDPVVVSALHDHHAALTEEATGSFDVADVELDRAVQVLEHPGLAVRAREDPQHYLFPAAAN